MTETIFEFNERNYRSCQQMFRGVGNQDYYLGDYSIEAGSVVEVRADKKKVGASSIIRLHSKTRLLFRRSWSHIREDATDVTVLWFVKSGRMSVTHQSGCSVAHAGDFLITRSSTPFFIECQIGEEGVYEVLHVLIPTHALSRFLPHEVRTGFCACASGRDFRIAERLLMDIFEDNCDLEEHIAQLLLDSVLCVLSEAVRRRDAGGQGRQTPAAKRLKDAFTYLEIHVSDPNLSIGTVASACGISVRYLSHLLKVQGTSFTTLMWRKRLEVARGWLLRSKPGEVSIAEIAYGVGFKSPAHFSRMFKRVFDLSPCAYREAGPLDSTYVQSERVGAAAPVHSNTTALQFAATR